METIIDFFSIEEAVNTRQSFHERPLEEELKRCPLGGDKAGKMFLSNHVFMKYFFYSNS